ncbi:aspartate/glutamate racemase family protein [Streptomyces sp. NPDC057002]|uniref:aspartate/glutamate racemase family protein n=1 Tax=Streptomyces sp. NPDC057002 TaxID=3345992 RepID=UPI0036327132
MADKRPVVALIHAVASGARIANDAFAEAFPEAVLWNLLDDRLLDDALAAGGLDGPLRRRMLRLIEHAVQGGAEGVLLTCSSYGSVADTARRLWDRPVHKSDEAMFRRALAQHPGRLVVAASTAPAVPAAVEQLRALAAESGAPGPRITTALCAEAAQADSPEQAAALLAHALRDTPADAVLLAQYSLTPAAGPLENRLGVPVLSGARAAALALRDELLAP